MPARSKNCEPESIGWVLERLYESDPCIYWRRNLWHTTSPPTFGNSWFLQGWLLFVHSIFAGRLIEQQDGHETLELICCPFYQSALSLKTEQESQVTDEGILSCSHCERNYPIRNRIFNFIDPQELKGTNRRFVRFYNHLAPLYSIFTKSAFITFGGDRKERQQILKRLEFRKPAQQTISWKTLT